MDAPTARPDLFVDDLSREVERDLALPAGFLGSLPELDDWSFVIKAHAVLEALLTHALVAVLGRPELLDIVSRLELSGARTGKVEIAKALGILGSEERRFIRTLSELRNDLVHDITRVSFSFESHVAALNSQQRTNFEEAFGLFALAYYRDQSRTMSPEVRKALGVLVRHASKLQIAFGITTIASQVYQGKLKSSTKQLAARHSTEYIRTLRETKEPGGDPGSA